MAIHVNYSILEGRQMLFYMHQQHMVPDMLTVPHINEMNTVFSEISQQADNIYEQIAIITQIWQRAKFYFMCISSQRYWIMIPNMRKIHPTIMEEYTVIMDRQSQTDRLIDQNHSYIPQFRDGGEGNNT